MIRDNRMGKKGCENVEKMEKEERDRETQEQGSGNCYNVKTREEGRGRDRMI
jgi:hypothetical protein